MEVVNEGEIPRVRCIYFLRQSEQANLVHDASRTLSVAIFIHSSKFEFMTSRGTFITGGGTAELSCCCCFCFASAPREFSPESTLAPDEGPASAVSMTANLVLFRRRRFSAASSLMLTVLNGARPESEVKLPSVSSPWASLMRFLLAWR